jgi:hypothetical protein
MTNVEADQAVWKLVSGRARAALRLYFEPIGYAVAGISALSLRMFVKASSVGLHRIEKTVRRVLLSEETIRAIKERGRFVSEKEISAKLLLESNSDMLAAVLGDGLRSVREQVIQDAVGRAGFVREGRIVDALIKESPDALVRLQRLIKDVSSISQTPKTSQQDLQELLNSLAQAVEDLKDLTDRHRFGK